MDQAIVQFATENYLTLTLAFTMLIGVEKITPWAWDDSIVSLHFLAQGLVYGTFVSYSSHSIISPPSA